MITINLKNIEELIFKNYAVKTGFPELKHIFDKWFLSYRSPSFANMKKMAMIEMLNAIDTEKLSNYFNDKIIIETLDTNIVKNLEFNINDPIEQQLTKYSSYNNMTISRNSEKIYLTLWR